MSINVTDENFETEVIERSKTTPVLVDFWAEWCGPCRMIGPVLEKVEREFDGRFILAKLDTDHNQRTAGKYRISGIPAVKLFANGGVIDEFTGALPEPHVRKFLNNSLPDHELAALIELSKTNASQAAESLLEKGLTGAPADEILWAGAIERLSSGDPNALLSIRTFVNAIPSAGSRHSDAKNHLLKFLDSNPSEEDLRRFGLIFTPEGEREGLDYFLAKVERSEASRRDLEKEALLVCFFLMGNANPLVNEYRRKLASILY